MNGDRCNVVQCACRAEQNGIALPCEIDVCEINVLPHESGASKKTPPHCVLAARPSQLVSVHPSRSSQCVSHLFQTQGNLTLGRNIDHCNRLVVFNTRCCIRHDSLLVSLEFSTFPTFPSNPSQSSTRSLSNLSRCFSKFLFQISRQSFSPCSCAQQLE